MPKTATEDTKITLTPRQMDILKLLAQGSSSEEISRELHLEVSTVLGHVNHIIDRLGTVNRTHAVAEALRRGLIN